MPGQTWASAHAGPPGSGTRAPSITLPNRTFNADVLSAVLCEHDTGQPDTRAWPAVTGPAPAVLATCGPFKLDIAGVPHPRAARVGPHNAMVDGSQRYPVQCLPHVAGMLQAMRVELAQRAARCAAILPASLGSQAWAAGHTPPPQQVRTPAEGAAALAWAWHVPPATQGQPCITGEVLGESWASTQTQVLAFGSDARLLGLTVQAARDGSIPVARAIPRWPGSQPGIPLVACAAGAAHSLALDAAGRIFAWGAGAGFRLGLGDDAPRSTPTVVRLGSKQARAVAITAGSTMSAACTADGQLYAWGSSASGALMLGATQLTAKRPRCVLLPAGAKPTRGAKHYGPHVVQVSAGVDHLVAVTRAGQAWAAGDNAAAQCGDASLRPVLDSPRLLNPAGATAHMVSAAAGAEHTVLVDTAHRVWQCGWGVARLSSVAFDRSTAAENALAFKWAHSHRMPVSRSATMDLGAWRAELKQCTAARSLRTFDDIDWVPPPATWRRVGKTVRVAQVQHWLAVSRGDVEPELPAAEQIALRSAGPGQAGEHSAPDHGDSTGAPLARQLRGPTQLDEQELLAQAAETLAARRTAAVERQSSSSDSDESDSVASSESALGPARAELDRQAASSPAPRWARAAMQAEIVQAAAGARHILALDSEGCVWVWAKPGGVDVACLAGQQCDSLDVPVRQQHLAALAAPIVHISVHASGSLNVAVDATGSVWTWGASKGGLGHNTAPARAAAPAQVERAAQAVAASAGAEHVLILQALSAPPLPPAQPGCSLQALAARAAARDMLPRNAASTLELAVRYHVPTLAKYAAAWITRNAAVMLARGPAAHAVQVLAEHSPGLRHGTWCTPAERASLAAHAWQRHEQVAAQRAADEHAKSLAAKRRRHRTPRQTTAPLMELLTSDDMQAIAAAADEPVHVRLAVPGVIGRECGIALALDHERMQGTPLALHEPIARLYDALTADTVLAALCAHARGQLEELPALAPAVLQRVLSPLVLGDARAVLARVRSLREKWLTSSRAACDAARGGQDLPAEIRRALAAEIVGLGGRAPQHLRAEHASWVRIARRRWYCGELRALQPIIRRLQALSTALLACARLQVEHADDPYLAELRACLRSCEVATQFHTQLSELDLSMSSYRQHGQPVLWTDLRHGASSAAAARAAAHETIQALRASGARLSDADQAALIESGVQDAVLGSVIGAALVVGPAQWHEPSEHSSPMSERTGSDRRAEAPGAPPLEPTESISTAASSASSPEQPSRASTSPTTAQLEPPAQSTPAGQPAASSGGMRSVLAAAQREAAVAEQRAREAVPRKPAEWNARGSFRGKPHANKSLKAVMQREIVEAGHISVPAQTQGRAPSTTSKLSWAKPAAAAASTDAQQVLGTWARVRTNRKKSRQAKASLPPAEADPSASETKRGSPPQASLRDIVAAEHAAVKAEAAAIQRGARQRRAAGLSWGATATSTPQSSRWGLTSSSKHTDLRAIAQAQAEAEAAAAADAAQDAALIAAGILLPPGQEEPAQAAPQCGAHMQGNAPGKHARGRGRGRGRGLQGSGGAGRGKRGGRGKATSHN